MCIRYTVTVSSVYIYNFTWRKSELHHSKTAQPCTCPMPSRSRSCRAGTWPWKARGYTSADLTPKTVRHFHPFRFCNFLPFPVDHLRSCRRVSPKKVILFYWIVNRAWEFRNDMKRESLKLNFASSMTQAVVAVSFRLLRLSTSWPHSWLEQHETPRHCLCFPAMVYVLHTTDTEAKIICPSYISLAMH